MNTIFVKIGGGVKPFGSLAKRGVVAIFILIISAAKAQTTFTTNILKADSANIKYTKTDSMSVGVIRTDTLCSAKDLCVHQDAKISGNVEVSGQVIAKSGILMDTNTVGIFKTYVKVPSKDSAQASFKGTVSAVYSGPIGGGSSSSSPPLIDDACSMAQNVPGSTINSSGGFVAKAVGWVNNINASVAMYPNWWDGSAHIELSGTGLPGQGLFLNYWCGKDIYLGTGFGTGGDWKGTLGSKIYTGDFVRMRKHLEIGDPTWGTTDVNNINIESHGNNGIANIRAKTWSVNMPQLSVFNTNTGSSGAILAYNGRNTFVVYGNGKTVIRSLDNTQPLLSVGQYTSSNNTEAGIENFKVYSSGKTIIGTQQVVGTHSDALLQVAGKSAAKSFYVLKPTTWADKVFETKINLSDLDEIEKYIKKHKHLPGVPSEEEIVTNGYDVNEMNTLLLGKIEELYLMMIALKKENEKLRKGSAK